MRIEAALGEVVAVQRDVERADGRASALECLDGSREALGERDATRLDADEHEALEATVALDDLVREACERPAHAFLVEDDAAAAFGEGALRHKKISPARGRSVKRSMEPAP